MQHPHSSNIRVFHSLDTFQSLTGEKLELAKLELRRNQEGTALEVAENSIIWVAQRFSAAISPFFVSPL